MLAVIYFPFLKLEGQEEVAYAAKPDSFYLSIPKIKAEAPIIENVDPWNENEYKQALDKGVALAKGFAGPGEGKEIFLFAHSSEMPWKMTRTNTAFLRLGEVNAGDEISIFKDQKQFKYRVILKKEVWPNEVNYLLQKDQNQLILQTCTPVGTSFKRLLVFATPI